MSIDHLDAVCVCRRPEHKPTRKNPSVWESNREGEKAESWERRHRQARVLCRSCPMLDACETELSRLEKEGKPVDGIVAGRYCDIPVHAGPRQHAFTTVTCRGCQERIIPQAKADAPWHPGKVLHVGEGLCENCFPRYSRAARKTTRRAA